jgi:hypothetical protein
LKRNAYFLPKRKNTGIYIPIIQDKTFNQRKSNYNIRNKCRTIERHRPNSAPGEKTVPLTFADRFFRQTTPLRIIINFTKTLTPCR